ncbi:TspO/MBR family protein [Ahrensia sp. R2A130]|uniref:TspO/MBR family protein n=1 Tax=Ahrensia sp. R2A130 TaxID=744979 RepID=UPI0001E0F049|nr:TspO/MBR family protein [Ahrensia sp. R2A130]EFL90959.1 translocator protein [Ahrensia sp. R2A130]
MARFITLIVFILFVNGVGAAIGLSFPAGEWYEGLNKPFFDPPGYLFGIVWPILYVLIAIAGWRVFTSNGETPGWGLWLGQLVLNFAWSPVFFGMQEMFWAIWIILGVLVLSLAFISTTWTRDKLAAFCFIPYVAWLSFALVLNVSVWWLNT